MRIKTFDVFLSHNSKDKPAVRELAEVLHGRGLAVWLDEWALAPGSDWQLELQQVLRTVRAVLVVVGPGGVGAWGERELRASFSQLVKRELLLVPVLLPGAAQLPLFLNDLTWLDLRDGMTEEKISRLVTAIRARLPKRRLRPSAATAPDPDLEAYKGWARQRIEHVPLIGVGGGDFKLRFDEIYVPLRLAARREMLEPRGSAGKKTMHELEEGRDLKLENLFGKRRGAGPHAVVLGHPGAGKTTVLRKIEHLCLNQGPERLGLPAGTVPLFLRLRQVTREDLEKDPAALLAEWLAAEAATALPADFGARLWRRGYLLLLLDGLDEIADAGLRAAVCRYLAKHLPEAEGRGVVAAVSCRFTGWGGSVVLPEPRFRAVEVCPLDAAGCESLVRRWFEELEHAHPDHKENAQRGRRDLLAALGQADYRTQRLKVLVGSPLLLTLLCLIVLRGRKMPRHRWAFYDECLRVLLEQWSHGKAAEDPERREPPLDVETALSVLRAVAWELHTRPSAGDAPRASLVLLLGRRLRQVGAKATGEQVFEWLLREAGVVGELSTGGYGFRHLGLEEYLAALHAASSGEALLDWVAERFGKEGWQEIPLLLVGLPGRQLFAPLMERLLAENRFLTEIDLLRDCLEEAAEVDLTPFLGELAAGKPPERQAAVLRLLLGRQDPRLLDRAGELRDSPDRDVRALALQVVAAGRRPEGDGAKRELFVLWHPEDPRDETAARGFLEAVNGQGLRAASLLDEPGWEGDSDRIVNGQLAWWWTVRLQLGISEGPSHHRG